MISKGYKHTGLGVLPEDWEVVRLGEVCNFLKTYSKSRSDLSESQNCIDGVAYIHYGDIHTKFKHFLDMDKDILPSIDSKKLAEDLEDIVFVENGDLVIADASEDYEDIGKSVEVKNLSNPTVSGLHTILCRDKSNYFANGYKGYMFSLYKVHKQIKRLACGISVLGISRSNLSKIQIPLPPLAEQEKIAEILSTWDTQIQNFESLITEKQNLKKGLCQTLLTAKTRLKGFSEDWEAVRLGEVCEICNGFAFQSKNFKKNGFPIVRISNIKSNNTISLEDMVYFSFDDYKNRDLNKFAIYQNDILVALSGATTGKIGKLKENVVLYLNQRVGKFQPSERLNNDFLYQCLLLQSNFLFLLSGGGAQPNLSTATIKDKVLISLPPLAEQEKIAEILSEADNEITLLEQKLESLKYQKKGLMQNLLNGKVRVKYNKKNISIIKDRK